MSNRRIPIITKKISAVIVTAGILLCGIFILVAYVSFSRQFRMQYDSDIRAIADAARQYLNPDDFGRYLQTSERDDKYNEVHTILQNFVNEFDLNLMYVSSVNPPDYTHITYLYNPVRVGGKWKEFPLGYAEDYFEPHYNSSAKSVFEDGQTIVRHTLKTRSGSHITAMLPVSDSDGRIVAVIGVQKPIQGFVSAVQSFCEFVIIIELIFAVVFFSLFAVYLNHRFIRPMIIMTNEVQRFAEGGEQPSDVLLDIKSKDELSVLANAIRRMEYDVSDNIATLTKVTGEKERMATELNVATDIQMSMLRTDYPAYPDRDDFDVFASMRPAKEVGGDLYDYMLVDDDRLMMCVGDVSGKGVPAALFMMIAKILLTDNSAIGLAPAGVMTMVNNRLCQNNSEGLFVTCWLGILTFSTGELCFVNAGHTSPVLYHDGKFEYLKTHSDLMLGCMGGVPYTEQSITLSKGDRLFLYSDGATDARNIQDELYGEKRLMSVLQETAELDAPAALELIRGRIDEFVGEAQQFDDITMLQFIWRE